MIKIENLQFKYDSNQGLIIDNISLEIKQGEHVVIVGNNGSGKTTLFKLLAALYKPLDGNIFIDNIIYTKDNIDNIRKDIGIIFQNPDDQFIGMTVEDDIAFGLENRQIESNDIKKKIDEIASKFSINNILKKEPNKLSGGQKQKVAIASVFALDPKIFLFDEITSMLDYKSQKDIMDLIESIKKEKDKTIISTSHNINEILLADKLILLNKGKLIAYESVDKILNNKKIMKLWDIELPLKNGLLSNDIVMKKLLKYNLNLENHENKNK